MRRRGIVYPPAVPSRDALLSDLRAAAGDSAVRTDPADLFAWGRDLWPRLTLEVRDAAGGRRPEAVVRPADEDAALRVVRVLARHGIPAVPFGAGSGVCGGAAPLFGGVVVDLKRLDRMGPIDGESLQVSCGPGLMLQTLEDRLNDAGFTLGHFPSSIWCCSVGGCVAARGAGQLSSRYGKIEDMTTGLRVATPALGVVATGSLDPLGSGPDWTPMFTGSEGTLGLITQVRLRIHPLAAAMVLRGVRFPSIEAGIDGFRRILQGGLRPSVMRLYDPLDTWMAMHKGNDPGGRATAVPGGGQPLRGGARSASRDDAAGEPRGFGASLMRQAGDDIRRRLGERLRPENLPLPALLARPAWLGRAIDALPGRCLAVLGCEGAPDVAAEHLDAAVSCSRSAGGVDLGPGPGERWFRTRYHVSFKLPKLLSGGGFADTMETAAPWSRVLRLYRAVREAVSPHVLVMAHLSHAYREGCSIYFTMAGFAPTHADLLATYDRAWRAALDAAAGVGATITHHHGIGVLKRDSMDREQGASRRLWAAARAALDPGSCMNPGKLFGDAKPLPPKLGLPDPAHLLIGDERDGVVEAGVGWSGADLSAALGARGLLLPPLGREFLCRTVGEWLAGPALAAWTAVHGAWEHPLLAVEGRFEDGRPWRSGRLPRSAAGPSWLPFACTSGLPLRAVTATFRAIVPPVLRLAGFAFQHRDSALLALRDSLRGALPPLAGAVFAGKDPRAARTVLQDGRRPDEGGVVLLAFAEPLGFPAGPRAVEDNLAAAGGLPVEADAARAWWRDHWATVARDGSAALEHTGPVADDAEFGHCSAVVSWRRAGLLLSAIETLVGGPARAAGWIEAPRETGCTVRFRFAASRRGGAHPALVRHEVEETIRSFGGRICDARWDGDAGLPDGVRRPAGGGDSERIRRALAAAMESDRR